MLFDRYENRELLKQYILSQYGPFLAKPYLASESFYQEILREAQPYIQGVTTLDVGCALGRLVFEYENRGAKKCVGVETSRQFITFCNSLKTKERGDISFPVTRPSTAEFLYGDILEVPLEAASFSFISCINVIDRVPNPQKLVNRLHALLASGGALLLVDPYDWQLSSTPKEFRVDDMKELLASKKWEIIKERRDIAYTTPIDAGRERTYQTHMLILKK